MEPQFIERDHGLRTITGEVAKFRRKYVAVGFFEGIKHMNKEALAHAVDIGKSLGIGKGASTKAVLGQAERTGEFDVAQIAAVHEYGAPAKKIPERSFMRSWVAAKKEDIAKTVQHLHLQVTTGKLTADAALKRLGVFGVAGMQRQITHPEGVDWKPLSDLTVLRKKSSRPLIDTGQMRASIHFEVRGE